MNSKKIISAGIISGLVMGVTLFVVGAIASRIIYGPQFAPPGKFDQEQLNPFYFIWTKLLIGMIFGILFTFLYEMLPLSKKINAAFSGLKYGFWFWLIIFLWSLSHPLTYGSLNISNQIFWAIYSLSGFLMYGFTLGLIYRRRRRNIL
ncbi:hypothetical protein H8E88_29560 [candidate division KSB1 bacterium]|nr:hypothetical protein [candidate division KSB1 bacterium]MBL7095107.1 hypothetical protein [candidate division KSB1 bacterium]